MKLLSCQQYYMRLGGVVEELEIMVVEKSISQFNPYTGANQNTYIDYDQIYANNLADADGIGTSSNYLIRASMNNHAWYGLVTNFKKN